MTKCIDNRGLMPLVIGLGSILVAAFLAPLAAQSGTRHEYTIAFKSFAPNNSDLFLADGDGGNPRALVSDSSLDYDASFSPDGKWIVFTSNRSGTAQIYRIHPDGSGLTRLTQDRAFDDQGTLSPDGKSLALVSSRSGQADIWIQDLGTRKTWNITRHPAGDFRPAWSPDGKWIAFSSDRDPARKSCPNTTKPGPAPFVSPQYVGVYIVRRDGSGLRRISTPTEIAGTPHWSSDGSHLVFWSGDPEQVCAGGLILGGGTTQIVSVDVASGTRDVVTSGPGLKVFPRWVTSNRIAYVTREGLRFTGSDSTVAGEFAVADWSPDRRTMVFHREIDPRGDRDRPFQSWPSPDARFALLRVPDASSFSPTGDRMVYMLTNFSGPARNGTLVVANADGSNRRAIYAGPLTQDMTGPAWSPRGDAIAFGTGGFFQRAQIQPAWLMTVAIDGTALSPLTRDSANAGMSLVCRYRHMPVKA